MAKAYKFLLKKRKEKKRETGLFMGSGPELLLLLFWVWFCETGSQSAAYSKYLTQSCISRTRFSNCWDCRLRLGLAFAFLLTELHFRVLSKCKKLSPDGPFYFWCSHLRDDLTLTGQLYTCFLKSLSEKY